jgi:type 1 glutamine amidotransferase
MDSKKSFARHAIRGAVAAAIGLVAAAGASAQANRIPIDGHLPAGALASSWDNFYYVCRGMDPACYHDWIGQAARTNRVLIVSRTTGPRHAALGNKLAAGLNPARDASNVALNSLIAWLAAAGVTADWTEDVTRISGSYKAWVFLDTSGDMLQKHGTANSTGAVDTTTGAFLDAAKVNLRQYMRAGGGFVAIHSAVGTEHNWPYYEGLLGNTNGYDTAGYQMGAVNVVGSADSATAGLANWTMQDEFTNLAPYPTNVKFLATVDESTLAVKRTVHPGHGSFHPVAWCQYYDGGRVFATTLGHDVSAWSPGNAQFQSLVVNGIKSAAGLTPFCTR